MCINFYIHTKTASTCVVRFILTEFNFSSSKLYLYQLLNFWHSPNTAVSDVFQRFFINEIHFVAACILIARATRYNRLAIDHSQTNSIHLQTWNAVMTELKKSYGFKRVK